MKRFRIRQLDTIKATLVSENGKLLSSVYDSGFSSISEVKSRLISKVPYYSGRVYSVCISNLDKEEYKSFNVLV
jgi:hypothetical protein